MATVSEKDGAVLLRVRVRPRASRNSICMKADGRARVGVTAPAVDGAANRALRALMAKTLGIPKSAVTVKSGERSRDKTLRVEGVTPDEVRDKLSSV